MLDSGLYEELVNILLDEILKKPKAPLKYKKRLKLISKYLERFRGGGVQPTSPPIYTPLLGGLDYFENNLRGGTTDAFKRRGNFV